MSSAELLRTADAVAQILGAAELEVAQAVQLAAEEASGSNELLRQTLIDDLGLAPSEGEALANLLIPVKKAKVEEEPPPDEDVEKETPAPPISPQEEKNKIEVDPILSDPVLAAKVGRFEQLKNNEIYLKRLREEARREYLRKRELEQVELGERVIEERLWLRQQTGEVTEVEVRDIHLQQQTVEIAKQVIGQRAATDRAAEGYVMPTDYDEDSSGRLAVIRKKFKDSRQQVHGDEESWQEQKVNEAGFLLPPAAAGDPQAKVDLSLARPRQDPQQRRATLISEKGTSIEFVLDAPSSILPPKSEDERRLDMKAAIAKAAEARKLRDLSLQDVRRSLPVYQYRRQLLEVIRDRRVVIVVGETGSGKTTQIPQYLAEVGYAEEGVIACTQPRRVAAMSVAARVAEEMQTRLGDKVGYTIRFEDKSSDNTILKYMTDGMLLREFLQDAMLTKYSAIIVDEAHERTLHTDVLFALLKDLSRERAEDFRLIVSSATLEAEKFAEYFDEAPIFQIPGRLYPVEMYYVKTPEANYLMAAVITVVQIHTSQPLDSGDILVFLPGQQEIEEVQEMLQERNKELVGDYGELIILPIYANLPTNLQTQVFAKTPKNSRKVVLATNIAETSITIDNIVYVVDPGLVKQNSYSSKYGIEALQIVPCSKAAVNQRAGRAGRVRPGMCFRLFPKSSYQNELEDSNVPEVLRSNLGNVVLTLMSMNIQDVLHFDFMDPPPPSSLINSLDELFALGALSTTGKVTALGKQMAEFPLEPMYSKTLLSSTRFKCSEELCIIAAMLNVGNSVFFQPSEKVKKKSAETARAGFKKEGGDLFTLLNVYRQWEEEEDEDRAGWCQDYFLQHRTLSRARDIKEQLSHLLTTVTGEKELVSSGLDDVEAISRAILSGFFLNAARVTKDGSYKCLKNRLNVWLHPQSCLFNSDGKVYDLLVFSEIVFTTKEYMRNVISVEGKWLVQESGGFYSSMVEQLVKKK